jgi:hypothetical protein
VYNKVFSFGQIKGDLKSNFVDLLAAGVSMLFQMALAKA